MENEYEKLEVNEKLEYENIIVKKKPNKIVSHNSNL